MILQTESNDSAPAEQCELNNVRRSQRIKERQEQMGIQTLDPDVIGDNDDPSDPDFQ